MAKITTFRGGTAAVVQTEDFTPATVEVNDIFTITFFGEPKKDGSRDSVAISFTATTGTVANVTLGLTNAINNSTHALVKDIITAADMTTKLRLTADQSGVPYYTTASTTNGGAADTQTLTEASVTANAGPNDFGTAGNWSNGLPVSTDNINIAGDADDDGWHDILYGLLQTGITPGTFKVSEKFQGAIGDSSPSDEGDWKYLCFATGSTTATAEIRSGGYCTLLRIGADKVTIRALRPGKLRLSGDINEVRSYGNVFGFEGVIITGSVLDEFYLLDGTGQEWTIETAVTSIDRVDGNSGTIWCYSDVNAGGAEVNAIGGRFIAEAGAYTRIRVWAAVLEYNSDSNITLLESMTAAAIIDFTKSDADDVTITNFINNGGADLRTRNATVALTITTEEEYGVGEPGGF